MPLPLLDRGVHDRQPEPPWTITASLPYTLTLGDTLGVSYVELHNHTNSAVQTLTISGDRGSKQKTLAFTVVPTGTFQLVPLDANGNPRRLPDLPLLVVLPLVTTPHAPLPSTSSASPSPSSNLGDSASTRSANLPLFINVKKKSA
ncbi:hypothetical protein PM082_018493 [Marasmius tenuissimus]|nr:hypothetical protein PM082_018493 [Marasmius tenuissimus]